MTKVTFVNMPVQFNVDDSFKEAFNEKVQQILPPFKNLVGSDFALDEIVVGDMKENLSVYIPEQYGVSASEEMLQDSRLSTANGFHGYDPSENCSFVLLDIRNVAYVIYLSNGKAPATAEQIMQELMNTLLHELSHSHDFQRHYALDDKGLIEEVHTVAHGQLWSEFYACRLGYENGFPSEEVEEELEMFHSVGREMQEEISGFDGENAPDEMRKYFDFFLYHAVRHLAMGDQKVQLNLLSIPWLNQMFGEKLNRTFTLLEELFYKEKEDEAYLSYLKLLGETYFEMEKDFEQFIHANVTLKS